MPRKKTKKPNVNNVLRPVPTTVEPYRMLPTRCFVVCPHWALRKCRLTRARVKSIATGRSFFRRAPREVRSERVATHSQRHSTNKHHPAVTKNMWRNE